MACAVHMARLPHERETRRQEPQITTDDHQRLHTQVRLDVAAIAGFGGLHGGVISCAVKTRKTDSPGKEELGASSEVATS